MNFRSEDRLGDFNFEDSRWSLLLWDTDADVCRVGIKGLNLKSGTPHDPADVDLEIEYAVMTFDGLRVSEFRVHDPEEAAFEGPEAAVRLLEALRNGLTADQFDPSAHTPGRACLLVDDRRTAFDAVLEFRRVAGEWDALKGKAWYTGLTDY